MKGVKYGQVCICAQCGDKMKVRPCRVKEKNYCSRRCHSDSMIGSTPWNKGKGKVSKENELFRKSQAYKDWRKMVFERDEYTCQECGIIGGQLHADHIKPFAIYKKLRLSLSNGRTLCVDCHKQTDTYGWKAMHLKNQLCV